MTIKWNESCYKEVSWHQQKRTCTWASRLCFVGSVGTGLLTAYWWNYLRGTADYVINMTNRGRNTALLLLIPAVVLRHKFFYKNDPVYKLAQGEFLASKIQKEKLDYKDAKKYDLSLIPANVLAELFTWTSFLEFEYKHGIELARKLPNKEELRESFLTHIKPLPYKNFPSIEYKQVLGITDSNIRNILIDPTQPVRTAIQFVNYHGPRVREVYPGIEQELLDEITPKMGYVEAHKTYHWISAEKLKTTIFPVQVKKYADGEIKLYPDLAKANGDEIQNHLKDNLRLRAAGDCLQELTYPQMLKSKSRTIFERLIPVYINKCAGEMTFDAFVQRHTIAALPLIRNKSDYQGQYLAKYNGTYIDNDRKLWAALGLDFQKDIEPLLQGKLPDNDLVFELPWSNPQGLKANGTLLLSFFRRKKLSYPQMIDHCRHWSSVTVNQQQIEAIVLEDKSEWATFASKHFPNGLPQELQCKKHLRQRALRGLRNQKLDMIFAHVKRYGLNFKLLETRILRNIHSYDQLLNRFPNIKKYAKRFSSNKPKQLLIAELRKVGTNIGRYKKELMKAFNVDLNTVVKKFIQELDWQTALRKYPTRWLRTHSPEGLGLMKQKFQAALNTINVFELSDEVRGLINNNDSKWTRCVARAFVRKPADALSIDHGFSLPDAIFSLITETRTAYQKEHATHKRKLREIKAELQVQVDYTEAIIAERKAPVKKLKVTLDKLKERKKLQEELDKIPEMPETVTGRAEAKQALKKKELQEKIDALPEGDIEKAQKKYDKASATFEKQKQQFLSELQAARDLYRQNKSKYDAALEKKLDQHEGEFVRKLQAMSSTQRTRSRGVSLRLDLNF